MRLSSTSVVTLAQRGLKSRGKCLTRWVNDAMVPFSERLDIPDDDSEVLRFTPTIDVNQFRSATGTYTIIYHIENNLGHRSILRRTLDYDG